MVGVEGRLNGKPISILTDSGASLSYVSPGLVERFELHQSKFDKSWLVQLATRTKRRVTDFVKKCKFYMINFKTEVDLNILLVGYYDLLIGMDWLEKHKVVLN